MELELRWRHPVTDPQLCALTRAHGGQPEPGWWDRVRPHSLGLDTKTHPTHQRRGIATQVVRLAAEEARRAGCTWLHVDFDDADRLARFYFNACGFRPTTAGLIHLGSLASSSAS